MLSPQWRLLPLHSAPALRKNEISACDGIGRHARFRFSCSNACGFESLQAHQLRNSLFGTNPRLAARLLSRTGNFFASNRDPLRWVRGWAWARPEHSCLESVHAFHVGASCISFALTFLHKSERTHSAAPPFQITTASLGCDLALGRKTESWSIKSFLRLTSPISQLLTAAVKRNKLRNCRKKLSL